MLSRQLLAMVPSLLRNLAMMGSLSIIVAHHMYAMPPYPYIGIDYATQLSLFTPYVDRRILYLWSWSSRFYFYGS
jgi:hypothetical protein